MRSIVVFVTSVLVGLLTGLPVAETKSRPPNFVIFFADDLGYGDLGSYGHPYIRTPNLDALAAGGQRWTDFYVAASVCSPSRAALLTGRLPVRNGQYGERIGVYFPNERGGFPASEVTIAETLQQAGYRTAIFGKWHLGDAPHALPTRHGFDEWLGVPYSNDMDWVNEPDLDEMVALRAAGDTEALAASTRRRQQAYAQPVHGLWNVPLLGSRRQAGEYIDEVVERPAQQATLTARYTERAVAFIRASKRQPFLLYVPYTMPHTPLFRSDEFVGRSLGGRYGDVVEEIDASVGRVVETLRTLQLDKNTLVIFTSDNGPWLSMGIEGGRSGLLNNGKGTTFEGGMRVPAVFSWPGKIAPGVISDIGSTLDLFPTLAGLAGVSASSATDGLDLAATLLDEAASSRKAMPFYRGSTLYAYRQGEWKVHFITEGRYGLPPQRTEHDPPMLVNLHDDPSERFDVGAQYPAELARLVAAARQHQAGVEVTPPAMDARLQP